MGCVVRPSFPPPPPRRGAVCILLKTYADSVLQRFAVMGDGWCISLLALENKLLGIAVN